MGFAGCGALIGLDGIEHVACVGSECTTTTSPTNESGVEGSAEGSSPGEGGGKDVEPSPTPDASLSDGALCEVFTCPNNVELCDWFDGMNMRGSWTSKPGSAVIDKTLFPPSSVRLDVGAGASSTFRTGLGSTKFQLDVDVLARFGPWDKVGHVVLFAVSFVSSCGSPGAELTLHAQSGGIYLEATPGSGCSGTNTKLLGVLPTTDDWQHVTLTGDFSGGGMVATAKFGALTQSLTVDPLGGPIGLKLEVGPQTRAGSGAFSVSYDNLALDLK